MSKRETALSLNAGGGWTMNFVPYGIFLPINSGALILKELYQQSIAYAVKAEMSGLPTEQTVKIFLGALGTSPQIDPLICIHLCFQQGVSMSNRYSITTEFEFVSPTSSVPWEFIHNFSKQMLLTTAMGFTGQFVTEFVHEHGNKVIVAMRIVTKSMSVLRGSGMVT